MFFKFQHTHLSNSPVPRPMRPVTLKTRTDGSENSSNMKFFLTGFLQDLQALQKKKKFFFLRKKKIK